MSFLRRKRGVPSRLQKRPIESSSTGTNGEDSPRWEHEVFLSFHGEDTRKTLSDYLYHDLVSAGIIVFRDAEGLRTGESIGPKLVEAIRFSKISIPILSPGYAYSKWCLLELVEIVNCSRARGQLVLPMFYNVDPTHVRNQTGWYGDAFRGHKDEFDDEVVEEWVDALSEVGEMKGWVVEKITGGHQGKLVKLVVREVLRVLKKGYLDVTDFLVGSEQHIDELARLLEADSNCSTRIVGIYGIGGIGKTTLAKTIYNQLFDQFDSCCFLESVRDRDLRSLQKQLISTILKQEDYSILSLDEGVKMIENRFCNKKALIILDDFDHRRQLENLARKHSWFGIGTKIIVTTRIKSVLDSPEVDAPYELEELNHKQSLELFSKHAFRMSHPREEYCYYSHQFVSFANGLPLALEILGSSLYGKDKLIWESKLKNMRSKTIHEVVDKLKITYDGLSHEEQQIFLDIACLFNWMDVKTAIYMWVTPNYDPTEAIENLIDTCLIKIGEDFRIKMHDQLRDLGRKIVLDENQEMPWMRSRVWKYEEAFSLLWKRKGTEKVRALCLDVKIGSLSNPDYYPTFEDNQLAKLPNLKFLQLEPSKLEGNFHRVLPELRWLQWRGCLAVEAPTNFCLENLVVLDLMWGKITDSWSGWREFKGKWLKVLNLTGCRHLVRTPDFSSFTGLERLILEACSGLIEIDSSIGLLKNLLFINLRNCARLQSLPSGFESLVSLEELVVDGSPIKEFPRNMNQLEILRVSFNGVPRFIAGLTSLKELVLDGSNITELPASIGSLVKLQCLSLKSCGLLRTLPKSLVLLESLVEIYIDGTSLKEIHFGNNMKNLEILSANKCESLRLHSSIGQLTFLMELLLDDSGIRYLPDSIGLLIHLQKLSLKRGSFTEIPDSIGKLESLTELHLDYSNIMELPAAISRCSRLQTLGLLGCRMLQSASLFPVSLTDLRITWEGTNLRFPDSINLKQLFSGDSYKALLDGSSCPLQTVSLTDIICMNFPELERLTISNAYVSTLLAKLSAIPQLTGLTIKGCVKLQHLDDLPSGLTSLAVEDCSQLQLLPELPSLISKLSIKNCIKLLYLPELPYSLIYFTMHSCSSLGDIPDLSKLKSLVELSIRQCNKLKMIHGLEELDTLQILDVSYCCELEILGGIQQLQSLELLDVIGCSALKIPDLSQLRKLNLRKREEDREQVIQGFSQWSRFCNDIGRLSKILEVLTISNFISSNPEEITWCSSLKRLSIYKCNDLISLRLLPSNLTSLRIEFCEFLKFWPDMSNLKRLSELVFLGYHTSLVKIEGLKELESLTSLELRLCKQLRTLDGLELLTSLIRLKLTYCDSLFSLADLSKLTNLETIEIIHCGNLPKLKPWKGCKVFDG